MNQRMPMPDFRQARRAARSPKWFITSAVGARHAVPLQLRDQLNTSVFVEFAHDLERIREKSQLVGTVRANRSSTIS